MDFYSINQIAEKMAVNRHTVEKYIKNGQLKSYKVGKSVRIEKGDYEEWIRTMARDVKR